MNINRPQTGKYVITKITGSHLDHIEIDHNSLAGLAGMVWIDTYSPYNLSTFGWISSDEAEAIALAILEAVNESRKRV
jgi:hypothetical protein